MPWSTSSSNINQSVVEDLSSAGTTSIADSKSYGSTFSRRHRYQASCSTHYTSPLHSAPPSPALHPAKVANKDHEDATLFGMDSNHAEETRYFPFNDTLSIEADTFLYCHPSPEASQFATNENLTPFRNKQAPESGEASTMGSYPNSSTTDRLFDHSPSAETPSSHGSFDSADKDSDDEDIDLEKAADDALSLWFGISLARLIRPIRVIYAFEQVKWQCANILRDEGHDLQDDEFDSIPTDVHDAGESSGPTRSIRPLTDQSESSPSGDSIPLGGRTSQSGSPPQNRLTVKGKNKKYRDQEGFSCPYRKRNPIRFNIRDHEKCANRSFPNMTELKKHLTSAHFKDRCTRCQRAFSLSSELMVHIRNCPLPPGSITRTQDSDPEDGFGETVDTQLKSRGIGQKIKNWVHLWEALFPGDDMIPDHNYEVFDQYEHVKGNIAQGVNALVAREADSWAVNQEHLSQKIMNLVQEEVEAILARPKAFRQRRKIPLGQVDPDALMAESPEIGFVEVTEENVTSDTSFGSDFQVSMLSTPRCLSPDNSIGEAQDEQQYVHGSQHIDLPSGSMSTQSMDHRFDFVLDSGINSHPVISTDFGMPQLYINNPIVTYDGVPWLQRDQTSNQSSLAFMDVVSPTGDTYQPNVPNDADVANWVVGGNGQFFIDNLDNENMGFDPPGN
ncbi:hypothetical protein F4811DRAFT_564554 [Daldinia bambusicola]|nr:hypothetical protein F4811DRAFT_564554 [Daldinia bambusicola]